MTTVFLSGSRMLGRLNDDVRDRLRNIVDQAFRIILGDANGADKALQSYLHSLAYPHVTVYCAGGRCRNNVGSWSTRSVAVPPDVKGRAFYTTKDRAMADDADYGFVLWDGKSAGAIENVLELLKRRKKALVYLSPTRAFHTVASASDLRSMFDDCAAGELEALNEKIGLNKSLRQLEGAAQAGFDYS